MTPSLTIPPGEKERHGQPRPSLEMGGTRPPSPGNHFQSPVPRGSGPSYLHAHCLTRGLAGGGTRHPKSLTSQPREVQPRGFLTPYYREAHQRALPLNAEGPDEGGITKLST